MSIAKVSVLIPCYNHAEYLPQAIECVLNQTYKNIELIIADNGCTDNSYDVMLNYKDVIKIIRMEKNNFLLCEQRLAAEASGDYIALMTADDYWEPEKLERQIDVLENKRNVKMCSTWAYFCDDNLIPYQDQGDNPFFEENMSRKDWVQKLVIYGNSIAYPSVVIEADLWRELLAERKGIYQLTDYYDWIRCALKTDIFVVQEPLVKFRWHLSGENVNSSAPSRKTNIRSLAEKKFILCEIIDEMPDEDFIDIFMDAGEHNHEEILCAKFVLLDQIGEASRNSLGDSALTYLYRHYLTIASTLESRCNFSFSDYLEKCATIGSEKTIADAEKVISEQSEIIKEYKEKVALLSNIWFFNDIQKEELKKVIYESLSHDEKKIVEILYQVLGKVLNIESTKKYHTILLLLDDVIECLNLSADNLRLVGIEIRTDDIDAFKELASFAKKEEIDLEESLLPYLQYIYDSVKFLFS